jgi:hypothetical protein
MADAEDHLGATISISIPIDVLHAAGIAPGARLVARVGGPGRVIVERHDKVLAEFAGTLHGVYRPGDLTALRHEWD